MEKERYVELIENMQECLKISGTGLPGSEDVLRTVNSAIDDANVLIKNVIVTNKESGEQNANTVIAVFDAKLIYMVSSVVKQHAESIDANLDTFSADNFADNLVSYLEDSPLFTAHGLWDWSKLDAMSDKCFRHAPSLDYMLGTFLEGDIEPKVRKARPVPEKRSAHDKKKPENVKSSETVDGDVEQTVAMIYNLLCAEYKRNGKRSISYFHFILDPSSFGWTVENMFHFSFLVKDGLATLSTDQRGLPVITPVKRKVAGTLFNAANNSQCLMSLDMAEWRDLVKASRITTAMIQLDRTPATAEPQPSTSSRTRQ